MDKKREIDVRFWVGVAFTLIFLYVHVWVKELPIYFLALPGFLMGYDAIGKVNSLWKK